MNMISSLENINNNYHNNNEIRKNEHKTNHPFFSTEKRFDWVNKYCNGNDLHRRQKNNRKICIDNLEGGIGKFIETKPKKKISKQNIDKTYNSDYYKIKNKYKNDYNKYQFTQRVIDPEKNIEKMKVSKIKTFRSQEKNLRHITDGTYKSLMSKTPIDIPIKGRKRMNKSIDCGNKPDSILFYENRLEECSKDNNRLFGVERKFRTKLINTESVIPPYKFGRKHFFDKEKSTSLY